MGCLFGHKYPYHGSGCQIEYVWGICLDLTCPYLCDSSRLTQDRHMKEVQSGYMTVRSCDCLMPIRPQNPFKYPDDGGVCETGWCKDCKDFGMECHLDASCLGGGRHIKELESDGAQCV